MVYQEEILAQRGFKKVLIAEDQLPQRHLLASFFQQEGYQVITAHNGVEAVAAFAEHRPSLVLMDIIMPEMDGLEATRRIKALPEGEFATIIFLTVREGLAEMRICIEAGGDDFLTKPINTDLLKIRIFALQRLQELHQQLAVQHRFLVNHLQEEQKNQRLAQKVFEHLLSVQGGDLPGVEIVQRAADRFSGDLVLSRRLADGRVRIFLGDFTGHGLAAALGALPTAEVFYTLSDQGVGLDRLLNEMNAKLCALLPDDRFLAAAVVEISADLTQFTWWNGGLPSLVLKKGREMRALVSDFLALGILSERDFSQELHQQPCSKDAALLMMTDGILEAHNAQQVAFATTGFKDFLAGWPYGEGMQAALESALVEHLGLELVLEDDLSLVSVCLEAL
ncbi:PP2C family protein-serine/threonine phosphatase [Marinospirillum sp.]|uniref:PP2C family protein-serine/threonine phosphatase n=1 Tax=Marinospirillum sp. TaxID=2183934 RepID=UPI003A86F2E6